MCEFVNSIVSFTQINKIVIERIFTGETTKEVVKKLKDGEYFIEDGTGILDEHEHLIAIIRMEIAEQDFALIEG